MKNKLFMVSLICLMIAAFGCNKNASPFLDKTKSRNQAEKAISEEEKLEQGMRQIRELERLEKESEKITNLQEPASPPTINLEEPSMSPAINLGDPARPSTEK